MSIKKHIPNLFTIGNLISGSIACLLVARNGFYESAALLIFLAGIFDLFDGLVARKLGVSGPFGAELDSLADVVSFGLAPTIIAYSFLESSLPEEYQWLKYFAYVNVTCAAIRLAKFNIDTEQSTEFKGLPSPSNGLFWACIAAIAWEDSTFFQLNSTEAFIMLAMVAATSLAMVGNFKMFAFKFKNFGWKGNELRWSFIACIPLVVGIVFFSSGLIFPSVPILLLLYVLFSFFLYRPQQHNEIQSRN